MILLEVLLEALRNPIVQIGIAIILGGVLWRRKKSYAPDIASFATTTGICFTFIGIVIAVYSLGEIDESDIKTQLDELLTGIYVAFVPSIFGAIVAVFTHLFPSWFPPPPIDKNKMPSGVDEQILEELRNLNKNITGPGDNTLATRLTKITGKQDELIDELRNLSQRIADDIIAALKESIDKLNDKLGEQFGENFAKFAAVIPKLLEWQENYRKTIEDTERKLTIQSGHLQDMLDAFNGSRQAFEAIAAHTKTISASVNNFTVIAKSLERASDSIAGIKIDADGLNDVVVNFIENVRIQTMQVEQQYRLLTESTVKLITAIDAVEGAADKIGAFSNASKQLKEHVDALTEAMQTLKSFSDGMDGFIKNLEGKPEEVADKMEKITIGVLKQLGQNLLGISERLVDDYKELQKVIHQITNQQENKE